MSTILPSRLLAGAELRPCKSNSRCGGGRWGAALLVGALILMLVCAPRAQADDFDPHGTFLRHEIDVEVLSRAAGWTVEDAGGNTAFQAQSTSASTSFPLPNLIATYDGPGTDEDISQITGISFDVDLPATTPEFVRRSGGTTGNLEFAALSDMQIDVQQKCTWSVTDVDSSGLASASIVGTLNAGLWGNHNHNEAARPTPTTISFQQQVTALSTEMGVIDAGGGDLQGKVVQQWTMTSEIFEIRATIHSFYELEDNFPADFVRIDAVLPEITNAVCPGDTLYITADVAYVYTASQSANIRLFVTGQYDDGSSKMLEMFPVQGVNKDVDASLACPTVPFDEDIEITVPYNEVVSGSVRNLQSVRLTAVLDGSGPDRTHFVDYPVNISAPTVSVKAVHPREASTILRGVNYQFAGRFNVLQNGWEGAQLQVVLRNGENLISSFSGNVGSDKNVQEIVAYSYNKDDVNDSDFPGLYVPTGIASLELVAKLVTNDGTGIVLAESDPIAYTLRDGVALTAGSKSEIEIKRKGEEWTMLTDFQSVLLGNDSEIRLSKGRAYLLFPGNHVGTLTAKFEGTTTYSVRKLIWYRDHGIALDFLMGILGDVEIEKGGSSSSNPSPGPPNMAPPEEPEASTEEIASFNIGLPINNADPDDSPIRVEFDSSLEKLHFQANSASTPWGPRTLAWFGKGSGEVSSTTAAFPTFTLEDGHQAELRTVDPPVIVAPGSRQTTIDNGELATQSTPSSPISGLLAGNAGTLIALGRDSGELQNIDAAGNASLWKDLGPGMSEWGGLAPGANAGEVHVAHLQAFAGDTIHRVTSGSTVDLTDQVPAPAGLARAPDGNLFCASPPTGKVFRITPSGVVTEVATGLEGPSSVACDPTNGDVYVGTTGDRKIFHIPAGSGTPVEIFQFPSPPQALASDPAGGRVFAALEPLFASTGAPIGGAGLPVSTIHRVSASGSSEQIGTGFANPTALAADDDGVLYVADSALDSIFKVDIDVIRQISVSGNLNFGDVAVGESNFRAMTIRNFGNADLTVSSIEMPPDFSMNWTGGVIPAGGQQGVIISFTPTAGNVYDGDVIVHSDATAGDNTRSFTARAIGEPGPGIALSGDLDFGDVLVGFLPTRQLTITNVGTETLAVSGIDYPAGFSGNWTGSIAAGNSQQVTVFFEPTAGQAYGGQVTVNSDAVSGTHTIDCSGTGLAAQTGNYTGLLDSGDVSGSLQIDVKAGGPFSGILLLNGEKIRLRGTVEGTEIFLTVPSKNFGEIEISLTVPLNGEAGGINGSVSGDGFDATLTDGGREVYGRDNPFEDADVYTFALEQGSSDCAGYGTMKVDSRGRARLKGVLADGSRASWKGSVLEAGLLPVYVVVKRRKHLDGDLQLSGDLSFAELATTDVSGALDWRNESGGTGSDSFVGCRYTKPERDVRVLAGLEDIVANAMVQFGTSSAGMEVPDREVTIDTRNRVSYERVDRNDKFAMRIATSTGLLSGTVAIPGEERPRKGKFGGVVLQKRNYGMGCYQGVIGDGSLWLHPVADVSIRMQSASEGTATVANAFSYQIDATGAVGYGVEGTLPPGLTVNPGTGLISGTPSTPGIYYVTVWAENGSGEKAAQLLRIVARTLFEGTLGTYSGLVREAPMQHRSCGAVDLKLAANGRFSAKLKLGGSRFSFRGEFSSPGGAWNGTLVDRKNGLTYDVTLQMRTPGVGTQIDGTFSEAATGINAVITLDLHEYHQRHNPCALAGLYTAAFPGANTTARAGSDPLPEGDGATLVSINTGGRARLKGTAGDGARWSASGALVRESAGPVMPIYATVYRGISGALCGEAMFRDMPGVSDFDAATIYWRKPANPKDSFYPVGFEGEVPLVGSRFVPPARNERALDLADTVDNARFEVGSGDIALDPSERTLTWLENNRITYDGADRFSARVNARNGSFSGSFPYVDGGRDKKARFNGVLLQKQNGAFGNFRGITEAGWVTLGPPGQTVIVFFEDFEASLASRGWVGAAAASGFSPPPEFSLSTGTGNPGQSLRFIADAAAGSEAEGDTYSINLFSPTIAGPLATSDLTRIRLTADLRDADLANTQRFRIESSTDSGFVTITGRRQFDVSANGSFQQVGGALSEAVAIGTYNPLDPYHRIVINLNHNNWGFDDGNLADWDNVSLEVIDTGGD